MPLLGLRLLDLAGQVHVPGERDGSRGVAIVFLSPTCSTCQGAVPELNRLARLAATENIEFYGVVPEVPLTRADIAARFGRHDVQFPVLLDHAGECTHRLAPTHVPEAFVIDRDGAISYRGHIGDVAAPDERAAGDESAPPAADGAGLAAAIGALASGRRTDVSRVPAVGTPLDALSRPADVQADDSQPVNYARHVAPILHAHCADCHRPGEVAPFPLLSYDDASKRAEWIRDVTSAGIMPPWQARAGYGHFRGARRLSEREREILAAWAEAGAPAGDADDLPPPRWFAAGWQLGEPDLVLEMTAPFAVPADGPDIFRFFVIPIELADDQMVAAVEFRPGNPRIVHHSILYLDRSGRARELDAADPLPGYEGFLTGGFRPAGTLGFWAPGYTPRWLPEGVGQPLAPGTDLAMQLHYHPSGKPEEDRSQVGIYFARRPVEHTIGGVALVNFDVNIPPGEARHRMELSFTTPVEMELLDVTPHMHILGTEMKVAATRPDGVEVPLVWVDWDFNWQDQYAYFEPVRLPAGTRIDLEAYYDNSAENPVNPNTPPARVVFGEMTTDEMCICAFRVIERGSPEERQLLRRALREHMQQQLANPRVLLSLLQFAARGGGGPDGSRSEGLLDDLLPGSASER